MGRRRHLNIPQSAGSSPCTSNQNSTSSLNFRSPVRKIQKHFNNANDGGMSTSVSEYRSDDDESTPIPSLHGNLVRSRYRQDPLKYYEPLESIGEGSMGSVSKVRKRNEVIGGSARPYFVEKYSQPKLFGWLPVPYFCPLEKNQSDISQGRNSGRSINDSARSRGRNSPGLNKQQQQQQQQQNPVQACFAMFCCPAQEKQNLLLDPIHEHGEEAENSADLGPAGTRCDNFLQGCFGNNTIICGVFKRAKEDDDLIKSSAKNGETASTLTKQHSLYSNGSDNSNDSILDKSDYEEIERQLAKVLKRSTSSMITYGHKDVVYALKSIHLDRVSSSDFMKELKNEVAILKQLDHPSIVKCYETFMYKGSLYLVLELCSGSDLYSRDPYTEEQACTIIRAMFSAVAYMHSKRITHRDLKYENIMFSSHDPDAEVKIIDFGLSKKYADNSFLHDTVGTVYTMAPDLLKGGYTEKVDVWSLGVIAFMLLSSSMPFYGKDRKQVIKKIIKGNYQFISRRWKSVSVDAKNFVIEMLQHNPDKRPSAAKALNDPWLNRFDFEKEEPTTDETALMDKVQATIQTFAGYGKLKKLALMVIAYRASSKEIGFLRQMFDKFDGRHDGEVTMEEFKSVLAEYEYSDEELEYMFHAMDLDRTGVVHYSEFLAATFEAHGAISEEQLAECFDRLDNDDSGFITKEDILDFLGGDIPQSYVDDIMDEADENRDQKISYEEFLALWGEETDAQMEQDRKDVKERRHRRMDSGVSNSSDFSFDTEEDDIFDELAVNIIPTSFESGEIAKLLDAPETPTKERKISATAAFKLEKERSMRDASTQAQEQPSRESESTQEAQEEVVASS